MTPLQYATNNRMTIGQLFFLSWRETTRHSPAKEDCAQIVNDWNKFNKEGIIPAYVDCFLKAKAGAG